MRIAIRAKESIVDRVKAVSIFLLFVAMAMFGGCTIAEQDATDVGNQLQDGLQGRGRIVPNDPMNDSFGADYQ